MRNNLRLCFGFLSAAVGALALTACDPYAYSVGGSYTSGPYSVVSGVADYNSYGYGAGYGYGNPGFSTTYFVSTGSPRWGYDPYCHSYYDYQRRCYYDPYLYGYYPAGYRPLVVTGVPHPHGYRGNYCPPPARITNVRLANYHNRAGAYRGTSYSWARQVSVRPAAPPPRAHYGNPGNAGGRQPYGTANAARAYPNSYQAHAPAGRQASPQGRGTSYAPQAQPGRTFGGSNPATYPRQPSPAVRPQGSGRRPTMPGNYNVPVQTQPPSQRAGNPRERRQQLTPTPVPQVRQQPQRPAMPPAAVRSPQPAARPSPPAASQQPGPRSGGGESRRGAAPERGPGRVRGLGEGG
jgi:hypothetical protein